MSSKLAVATHQSTTGGILSAGPMRQRKCACGGTSGPTGECAACRRKKLLGGSLQAKFQINQSGDRYEHEADSIADQVMRMPQPSLQRQAEEEEDEEELLQTKPLVQRRVRGDQGNDKAPPIVYEVLRSPGRPLDWATQELMTSRFGHDFSQVRVHTEPIAAAAAKVIHARAYTLGRDIVFGRGQYQPKTFEGQHLLAHELAHVVQQNGSTAQPNRTDGIIQKNGGAIEGIVDFFTAGEVTFHDCTKGGHKLDDFAVIPESEEQGIFTPEDGVEHEDVDGFWWRYHSPATEWYKIPNLCEVQVTCVADDGITFSEDSPDCGFYQDSTAKGGAPRGPEHIDKVKNPFA